MREGFREDATSEKIFENCSLYSKSSTREREMTYSKSSKKERDSSEDTLRIFYL